MNRQDSPPHAAAPAPGDLRPGFPPAYLLRLWFGFTLPVSRQAYALSGVSLMTLKYGVDALLVWAVAGRFFTPLDYLNPLLSVRQNALNPAPDWALWAMALWAVPFLWAGVSMSARRALDAGFSPWLGTIFFFIPIANYAVMLALCLFPSAPRPQPQAAWGESGAARWARSAFLGVICGPLIALPATVFGVNVLGSYGLALFLGTPFLIGAASGYVYNYRAARSVGSTVAVVLASVVLAGCSILLFALEGLLCILMAAPFALVIGLLGGLLGAAIASGCGARQQRVTPALLLPLLLAGVDRASSSVAELPLREVVSAVEIDAPPERVWPHVVGFSELPPPESWARIEGAGVGAVRRCEFSTGAFVEPITHWEAPRRLAFDVSRQPPTMHEWSPYARVHPPHLDYALRSRRGEFRLTALAGGRTRLEGRTWYEIEMHPQGYWALWSNLLIHRIHERVLAHVKRLAEGPAGGSQGDGPPVT
jgi:uncharacterized membrane protein YhaH (DUF805 family)